MKLIIMNILFLILFNGIVYGHDLNSDDMTYHWKFNFTNKSSKDVFFFMSTTRTYAKYWTEGPSCKRGSERYTLYGSSSVPESFLYEWKKKGTLCELAQESSYEWKIPANASCFLPMKTVGGGPLGEEGGCQVMYEPDKYGAKVSINVINKDGKLYFTYKDIFRAGELWRQHNEVATKYNVGINLKDTKFQTDDTTGKFISGEDSNIQIDIPLEPQPISEPMEA